MRILITGGAGFIGSHLAEDLLLAGHHVILVDNLDTFYNPRQKRRNLNGLYALPISPGQLDVIISCILDAGCAEKLQNLGPIDALVHLAARPGVLPSLKQPSLYAHYNLLGTQAAIDLAHALHIPALVLASSSSVYGSIQPPFTETRVCRPISPYSATKLAAEQLLYAAAQSFSLGAVSLRIFSAYGSRMRPDLALPRFATQIHAGAPLPLYGNGERDFTHIRDLSQGIQAAIGYAQSHIGRHEVFNLGTGRSVPIPLLIDHLSAALGKRAQVQPLPAGPGEMPLTCADIEKARTHLGYQPKVPLEAGIEDFVRWFLQTAVPARVSA